jgi:hypothetical protein
MGRPATADFLMGLTIFASIVGLLTLVNFGFTRTIARALRLCQPHNRAFDPESVWFGMIPGLHWAWNFVLVNAVADSLANEYRDRGLFIARREDFARQTGTFFALWSSFGLGLSFIGGISILITFTDYWRKINHHCQELERTEDAFERRLLGQAHEDYGDLPTLVNPNDVSQGIMVKRPQ